MTRAEYLPKARSIGKTTLIVGALMLMAATAAITLARHFHVLAVEPKGAVDLKYYYDWIHLWFHGRPIYNDLEGSEYPPASMVILWPLVGWLPFQGARWLAAAFDAAALVCLAIWMLRASGATGWRQRTFAVLLLLSMMSTSAAIGNGQLILLLLPPLLGGVSLLVDRPPGWTRDLCGALLIGSALAKPSVSAPFLWLVFLARRPLRVVVLVAAVYIGETFLASAFQNANALDLLIDSVRYGMQTARGAVDVNIPFILSRLGLRSLMMPASAAMFAALGAWICRYRRAELWVLLGIASLVARLWIYHRIYDGVLVLVAEAALFRIGRAGGWRGGCSRAAGALLAFTAFVFLSPSPYGYTRWPPYVGLTIETMQGVAACLDLLFLMYVSTASCSVKFRDYSNGRRVSPG